MTVTTTYDIQPEGTPPANEEGNSPASVFHQAWGIFKKRVVEGLFFVLPILITCWIFLWLFQFIKGYVIAPVSMLILWWEQRRYPDTPLSPWFETYAAPTIAIGIVLLILFGLAFVAYSRFHRGLNWLLVNIPVFSWIYNPVRKIFETLETHHGEQHGHKKPQRIILVSFPHVGMRVPAIVTASCRDVETDKTILCVYVPTTPMPTSGYFLLVPEDEVTELNWDNEQTLQAIISGGLAAPAWVTYFKTTKPIPATKPLPDSPAPTN